MRGRCAELMARGGAHDQDLGLALLGRKELLEQLGAELGAWSSGLSRPVVLEHPVG